MQCCIIRKVCMSPCAPISFDQLNQRVLACQDKAFTLAFYILGNTTAACGAVQKAFLQVYANRGNDDNNISVKILQEVILMCRPAKPSKAHSAVEEIPGWELLDCCEQEALLLVDVLQESYQKAARILNNSESDIARVVAQGRYKLIRNSDSVQE